MRLFLFLVAINLCPGCQSVRQNVMPTRAEFLQMSYRQFDQSLGKGWRVFAGAGAYADAAFLIEEYRAMHRETLSENELRILNFHAGQMFAFANDYAQARVRFAHAVDPNVERNMVRLWNDYVEATMAFLDRDLVLLKQKRERMAGRPKFFFVTPNLNVVDAFIKCFEEPYAVAYSKKCID